MLSVVDQCQVLNSQVHECPRLSAFVKSRNNTVRATKTLRLTTEDKKSVVEQLISYPNTNARLSCKRGKTTAGHVLLCTRLSIFYCD